MSFAPAAPWDRIRAWIDEKEREERTFIRPARLTQRELTAISNLVPLIEEPDVSGKDYVSALHCAAQIGQCFMPTFEDESVTLTVNGIVEAKWRCYCNIGPQGTFPRQGFGLDETGGAPIFATKKNAKQYAAQQALAFMSNGAPTTSTAAASLPKRSERSQAASPSLSQVKKTRTDAGPTEAAQAVAAPADETSGLSVYERVVYLSNKLGLHPPTYETPPLLGMPNFFSGRTVFPSGADGRIPDKVLVVNGVLGKQQAKDQLARQVCDWMEREVQERQKLAKTLLPQ
ncbi:uncharacterized protein F5Z01DRAFT_653472 [Emericellopsis atlantica]|uniref:DRBM domain-containing protein n=1 Tax=Emericellopsis atlantica TaxID=2614577 RepID=A0A9P7ZNW4_9HYPO|nr:uncharacterized protein F5Z01DRAFT_653472 [Emericellopsis atlantica]KAG9254958.1 hypothetical protein F5Z01DRAFT_653472 [Emericellopsis atlantica]